MKHAKNMAAYVDELTSRHRCDRILVDARAFQDQNYSFKGIGRHGISLLSHMSNELRSNVKLIALCDPKLDPLPEEYRSVFDEETFAVPVEFGRFLLLSPSPLTHALGAMPRLLAHDGLQLAIAVVHDFIPYDFPGYFQNDAAASDYFRAIELLKQYDFFLPNSEYTALRLKDVCGIEPTRIAVTRVAVKDRFLAGGEAEELPNFLDSRDFVLAVCGQDLRKNVETAVEAIAILNGQRNKQLQFVVVGHYSDARKAELMQLAQRLSGGRDWLKFAPFLSDDALVALYRRCLAVIVPSFIEGFSMPVAEGIAAGSLVLASDCDAHRELVATPEVFFDPHSPSALADAIETLAMDGGRRDALIVKQAAGLPDLRETVVAERAWSAIAHAPLDLRRRSIKRLHSDRPRIALFSPYLPQETGVGLYSARMMRSLSRWADVDLYTDARPSLSDAHSFNAVRRLDDRFSSAEYDASVFVIGNTRVFHESIVSRFQEAGGAAVLHDGRMFEYYLSTLSRPELLAMAARYLGRAVTEAEIHEWDDRKEKLPHSFLTDLLSSAAPAIVHSREQQRHIQDQYRVMAEYLPFAIQCDFKSEELNSAAVNLARQSLGYANDLPLVCVFGSVDYSKGAVETVFALNELVKWNVPMQIVFVGACPPPVRQQLHDFAEPLGLLELLKFTGPVSEGVYRQHLMGADLALQLRLPLFGQVSGALSDCAAAGLPTVANSALADAIEAPNYVMRIQNNWSPILIAEALIETYERSRLRLRHDDMRAEYVAAHSFEYYAQRLLKVLGQKAVASTSNS